MGYVLERKNIKEGYFKKIDFDSYPILTFNKDKAKVFDLYKDAQDFNSSYLNNEYIITESEE